MAAVMNSEKQAIGPYYPEIDILRAIAILMVLLYHSILVYPVNLHDIYWCRTLHTYLWIVEMPLFFLVSGFCFSYPAGHYGRYLWKKCKRVLVPHLAFGALDILMRALPTGLVNQTGEPMELLREFVLFGGSDWFLWTLFVLFALFPVFHWMFQKGSWGKEAVILAVCLLFFLQDFLPGQFLLSTAARYLPYFFIGYLVRQSGAYEGVRKSVTNWGVVIVALLASALLFMMYLQMERGLPLLGVEIPVLAEYSDRIKQLLELLVAWNGAVLCFKLAELILKGPNPAIEYLGRDGTPLVDRHRGYVHRFFFGCSRYSLQLYLLDGYALVLTRTLLVSVLGITNPWALILGNFVLDTAAALLVSKFLLDKVKPLRMLCGL